MGCNVITEYGQLLKYTKELKDSVKCIKREIEDLKCTLSDINNNTYNIQSMLAHGFPSTIAAEFPTETEDSVVYSTNKVRLLDMLNPTLYLVFKGIINSNKQVYFKDTSGYPHIVCIGNEDTLLYANDIENNKSYKGIYKGNYIILDNF